MSSLISSHIPSNATLVGVLVIHSTKNTVEFVLSALRNRPHSRFIDQLAVLGDLTKGCMPDNSTACL